MEEVVHKVQWKITWPAAMKEEDGKLQWKYLTGYNGINWPTAMEEVADQLQ